MPVGERLVVWAWYGIFFIFAGWFFVWLPLCRPRTWFEWIVAKLARFFGGTASIVDERTLRARARWLGITYGAFLIVLMAVVFSGLR